MVTEPAAGASSPGLAPHTGRLAPASSVAAPGGLQEAWVAPLRPIPEPGCHSRQPRPFVREGTVKGILRADIRDSGGWGRGKGRLEEK